MKICSEKKTKSADVDGFTETKKFKVLHCGNVEGNSNKFYCIELQFNPTTACFRIFTHYGRLGITEVFGIRDSYDTNDPLKDLSFVEKEFDAIIKKKLRGKSIKDDRGLGESRVEKYEEVMTFSPKVGSSNIRGKSVQVTSSKATTIDVSAITNQKIVQLINQIVDENIHNITSLTSLTLTSSGFETPLGPVTKDQIGKAKSALDVLKSLIKDDKLDDDLQDVRDVNNLYYSLIPHQFGHKITKTDWILNDQKLIEEYDLLDQLESAIQMGSALNKNASQRLNALGVEIVELNKKDSEFSRLENYVHNSKASNHKGSDIWHWKVGNIYKIQIPDERKRYDTTKVKLGNIKELFHGSRNCNILSILKNGLIIPPYNAGHVTGRMFGNGIYGAHNSTKSLNYSTGWWSGTRNKYSNAFLFIVNFSMGNAFSTKTTLSSGAPKNFDSVWAKAGSGLYNDEYIVFTPNQSTITHLIEMIK
jgi:poly [ADP-ribose] polymerase